MWGSYEQKFAGLRAFFVWQMTHPGKKLTFMGCEFGQFREWDYENELEWFMLDYPMHQKLQDFSAELGNFYLSRKELWQVDFSWDGFDWIYADRDADNLIAFRRMDRAGHELVVVINFSAAAYKGYGIPVKSDAYRVVLNTEELRFGGCGMSYPELLAANDQGMITPDLCPLSAIVLEPVRRSKNGRSERASAKKSDAASEK